jgi:hypothetical protein
MKTFKKILSEVAQPKSSEEKAFKDLHNQKPGQHPVAPDNQFSGDIGKAKASRPADQEDDSNYDQAYGNKPNQEPVLRAGRKFSQFRANESKDMTNAKALDKASSASAEGKKKVSLAKAPWEKSDKNESISEAELDDMIDNMSEETLASFMEEIEQLDELSPELLTHYRQRAKGDINSRDAKTKIQVARFKRGEHWRNDQKNTERQAFRQLAKGKLQKKAADKTYFEPKNNGNTKNLTHSKMRGVIENMSDETLEEGPFKGVGKMMMKRKLVKTNKKLGKAYDAERKKSYAEYDHNLPSQSAKHDKHDKNMQDLGGKMRRTKKAYDRLDREAKKRLDDHMQYEAAGYEMPIVPKQNMDDDGHRAKYHRDHTTLTSMSGKKPTSHEHAEYHHEMSARYHINHADYDTRNKKNYHAHMELAHGNANQHMQEYSDAKDPKEKEHHMKEYHKYNNHIKKVTNGDEHNKRARELPHHHNKQYDSHHDMNKSIKWDSSDVNESIVNEISETLSEIAFGKWNEALKGGQKKLDHNKNGKIDGHDFAIMRARKKSNEEVDVIETTSSAMRHMVTQTGPDGKTRTVMKKLRSDRTDDRGQDVIRTNEASMDNMCCKDCGDMFGKPTKGNACKNDCNDPNQSCWVNKESYNEALINELDKKTLGSYIKKAHSNKETQDNLAKHHTDAGVMADKDKDMYKQFDLMHKHKKKSVNRSMGINRAVRKLVGEGFTEMLDEAVKMGNLRLKNGKNVKVSNQDAKLLNSFYKNLNAKNRRDMEKVMMKDEAGFKEIVGFAREAL